jgi:hypothetical protein
MNVQHFVVHVGFGSTAQCGANILASTQIQRRIDTFLLPLLKLGKLLRMLQAFFCLCFPAE